MSKKTPKTPPVPEWPHKVEVERLQQKPLRVTLSSTPEQRRDLARRVKVDAVDAIEATVTVERRPNSHVIHVSGALKADVVQTCIVTLEPVRSHIEEEISGWYS